MQPKSWMPRLVKVVNKNATIGLHRDRWDGNDFEFPVNREVVIPEIAAQHCFAYLSRKAFADAKQQGLRPDQLAKIAEEARDETVRVITRNMWNMEKDGKPRPVEYGEAILRNFQLSPVEDIANAPSLHNAGEKAAG